MPSPKIHRRLGATLHEAVRAQTFQNSVHGLVFFPGFTAMGIEDDLYSGPESEALFKDRADAGRQLARLLLSYRFCDPLVLGLPRGGVAVAAEAARALSAFTCPATPGRGPRGRLQKTFSPLPYRTCGAPGA